MEAGIDEAGRGPVLGPLVVAGVATADPGALAALGCRDSKRLTAAQRERLARLMRAMTGVRITLEVVPPEDLDRRGPDRSLNDIEVECFRRVAQRLGAPRVVVDAADVDAARFGARIRSVLAQGTVVVSEHQAEDRHPTVAAASILAKVARDEAIGDLARRLERRLPMPLGSGYPSDPRTRAFLAAWVERFGELPEGTRRSWATAQALVAPRPTTLGEFDAEALGRPVPPA